jgi:hypothetical protein
VFIVALLVNNAKTGKTDWQVDKVRVICDDYVQLVCHDNDEPYSDWDWDGFEYYIKLEE